MQRSRAPTPDLPRRRPRRSTAAVVLIAATLWGALDQPAAAQRTPIMPEAATGRADRVLAVARSHMVSAANPLAVEAGLEMLRAGGSAIDAAIAVQLVLNLVEPQSSGLGGGAFLLHWDAQAKDLKTYDGRETAPAGAKPDRFVLEGHPLPFDEAVHSGLSIGVPGLARLLETAHKRHGKLPWSRLFQPALELAEQGFRVSPRLHLLLAQQGAESFAPAARRYFFTENRAAWPVGALLRNPEFGATLRALQEKGASAFYSGPVASAVVEAVTTAPNHAGDMALTDLAGYEVKERPPLCFTYRRHRICGMGPPSSGGLAVAQVLGLLEPFDLGRGRKAAMNPGALHLIAEAEKLAFVDRDFYVADPDFVPVPLTLLDPGYLAARRTLIRPLATMTRPQPGTPPAVLGRALGEDATREGAGTSHFSIVDGLGNAVAMTTTIEAAFGSRVRAAGFLLNNQLTDFSFRPRDREGRIAANAVAAGKRPRSSMAPTIVFDEADRVKAVIGSPGGARIILYVIKALIALIDWELDAQAAAALLNFGSRGGAFEIEYEAADWGALIRPSFSTPVIWHALRVKPYGHAIAPEVLTSGLHIIEVRDGRLEGGADPRREGVARGD